MILRLRKKFIIIAMTSMLAVLGVIVVSINLINYANVLENIRQRMELLSENGGRFPKEEKPFEKPEPEPFEKKEKRELFDFQRDEINPETPFETRFFTVVLREDGEVISIDTGNIASIETQGAAAYAALLFEKEQTEGFLEHYRYLKLQQDGKWLYIFLDCNRELSAFYSFMLVSIMISLLAVFLVFLFLVFFSKRAVRPIAENYRQQKEFITNASHDLKTPLAVIQAATEVLELDHGESEWTQSIKNQVERMNQLTQKLVFLAKSEEQAEQLPMQEVLLSRVVKEAAEVIRPMAEAGNKQLVLSLEENIVVKGNEPLIVQLLTQLLDNAIRYTDPAGKIEVSLQRNGRRIRLLMKNTCRDLSAGDQDILFERFHRSDASRNSQTGGHGIGLSVVKAIAGLHKWEIHSQSDGEAMYFYITIAAPKGCGDQKHRETIDDRRI